MNVKSPIGKEALYSGRVQGVGFRQSVCSMAVGQQVRGYVQNLDNGRVKLVVEGNDREVDHLLDEVKRFWSQNISDIHITDLHITGTFSDFSVRF